MANYVDLPPLQDVKDVLHYDPDSGGFTWKNKLGCGRYNKSWNKKYAGRPAGSFDRVGYLYIGISGQKFAGHRLAWLLSHGCMPLSDIDHKDGNPSNNRLGNLRLATDSQNQANMKLPRTNTSGAKGVSWHVSNKRWVSSIRVGGKRIHLGTFSEKSSAEEAYASAARLYHGEYARPY